MSYRALNDTEEQVCRDNGIDPRGKSVVLAGEGFLLLLHHKTGDNIRINYGLARQRTGKVFLSGNYWSVCCEEDELPRKVLGLIAEHLGKIPKGGQAYRISKAMGIQSQLFDEMVGGEREIAERVQCGSRCTVTGLTINCYDAWQNAEGGILLASPEKEEMWVPASLCMASDKWMGIRDENSAVYITMEEVPYTIAAKLAYLEKFRWTV